ncbi:MAG: hypothetical protein U0235_02020 [Polyangiaceae bacterium]
MNPSPSTRGIDRLICAMTVLAVAAAASIASHDVPSEQKPCASGGDTFTSTASSGMKPRRKSDGTSLKNTGMYSARPSLTAARAFGPMKSALCRKLDATSGARCGPSPPTWRCTMFTASSSLARATSARRSTLGAAAAQ